MYKLAAFEIVMFSLTTCTITMSSIVFPRASLFSKILRVLDFHSNWSSFCSHLPRPMQDLLLKTPSVDAPALSVSYTAFLSWFLVPIGDVVHYHLTKFVTKCNLKSKYTAECGMCRPLDWGTVAWNCEGHDSQYGCN